MPNEEPGAPAPEPKPMQSPEALRVNAIIKRALEGAVASFNAVLIESGIAPLDGSYELVANLQFRRVLTPEEAAAALADDAPPAGGEGGDGGT